MKPIVLFLLALCFLSKNIHAQLFGNQDGKMIANNIEQISLLKTYSDYLDKGLTIAHDGLDLTHTFKNGEFDLHSLYYSSLLQVNPNVKKYPLVGQTVDLYAQMGILRTAITNTLFYTDLLKASEKTAISTTVKNLMSVSTKDIEDLNNLLTDDKYQLTDDERTKRIDTIYKRVVGKYCSLSNFEKRINTIIQGRKQQKNNISQLRQLYGIP